MRDLRSACVYMLKSIRTRVVFIRYLYISFFFFLRFLLHSLEEQSDKGTILCICCDIEVPLHFLLCFLAFRTKSIRRRRRRRRESRSREKKGTQRKNEIIIMRQFETWIYANLVFSSLRPSCECAWTMSSRAYTRSE